MNFKQIKELIRLMDDTGVTECEIEEEDFRIKLSKKNTEVEQSGQQPAPMPVPMPQMPQQPQQQASAPPQQESSQEGGQPSEEDDENLVTISSPMIGTFYRSPSPDRDPYVKVGDKVKKGDILCVIEAMKLFNEIESEYEGKIVKVMVDDASPVEYDQPLFLLDPS
ncbi:MAG: acetyl-CoA carboxylase biotin carboxyl carrier protein [Bacteroidetes bacterium SW_11_45_7]|nr:MAG: acetyl-CoA carboxylase biotin carboxyl carrier protein [Bacteroidetes bacterium SW_11_45_7]